jgi:hypothetical protein
VHFVGSKCNWTKMHGIHGIKMISKFGPWKWWIPIRSQVQRKGTQCLRITIPLDLTCGSGFAIPTFETMQYGTESCGDIVTEEKYEADAVTNNVMWINRNSHGQYLIFVTEEYSFDLDSSFTGGCQECLMFMIMISKRRIPFKNILGWSAVVSCEGELVLLCGI